MFCVECERHHLNVLRVTGTKFVEVGKVRASTARRAKQAWCMSYSYWRRAKNDCKAPMRKRNACGCSSSQRKYSYAMVIAVARHAHGRIGGAPYILEPFSLKIQ